MGSKFNTSWSLTFPARQNREILRQQRMISAGGTGALLLQPGPDTLKTQPSTAH